MNKFKIGDRVVLRADNSFQKQTGESNPAQGSPWACEGTIVNIYHNYKYEIDWDNGRQNNAYRDIDLDFVGIDSINIYLAFRHPYIR